MYIGGQLANTPDNLIAWLQDPQHFAPGTAMPNLLITEPAARDMAAYLYAQH
jgi:cytochrome c1